MESKTLVWIGIFVGSTVGSSIPLLWGASFLSFSSIFLSGVGAAIGIWLGWRISQY
jgi:hypothetical protein